MSSKKLMLKKRWAIFVNKITIVTLFHWRFRLGFFEIRLFAIKNIKVNCQQDFSFLVKIFATKFSLPDNLPFTQKSTTKSFHLVQESIPLRFDKPFQTKKRKKGRKRKQKKTIRFLFSQLRHYYFFLNKFHSNRIHLLSSLKIYITFKKEKNFLIKYFYSK